MRAASSLRSCLLCASAALLAGCPKSEPQFIVNRSSAPIHVRIAQPIYEIAPGKRALCEYQASGVRMGPVGNKLSSAYVDVKLSAHDPVKCEFELDVPAGYQVILGDKGMCHDYVRVRKRYPSSVPSPSSVSIAGNEGIIELQGWQVARQFKRQRDDSCTLIYE